MATLLQLLYAEDSPLDADLTRVHFESAAADIALTLVETGAACLKIFEQRTFDVLMLDNHLPDMDGIDVLVQLRKRGLRLPVVMVTGVGDDETVARALRAGASDYVPKNGNYLDTLPPMLRRLAQRQQAQQPFESDDAPRDQRVLYIEPNTMDAELTEEHFANYAPHLKLNLQTSCVHALAMLGEPLQFDLVLTDLRVPGMDALEFIREAKLRHIELPFVVITGKGDEATAVALLRLGASDYLVKRDNYLTQLPHAIDHALHRFRLEQTRLRLHSELGTLNATLESKVVQRTAELAASQASLRATFDAIPDLIWQTGLDGKCTACNPALARLLALPQEAVLGHTVHELFDSAASDAIGHQVDSTYRLCRPVVQDHWLNGTSTRDRKLFELVCTPVLAAAGAVTGFLTVARDITERTAAHAKIQRLSQLYAALSQCNQAIVHSTTERELFGQICRDAVRFGGMRLAWVGLLTPNATEFEVVTAYGEGAQSFPEGRYFGLDLVVADGNASPESARQGPLHPVWCQDLLNDPSSLHWNMLGLEHGWAASATLPLFRSNVLAGVFSLFAGETQAFDEPARALLNEMATDISFALTNFEREAARTRAEDALRMTRISIEASSEALFWMTPDARIVDVNEAACRSLGYTRAELTGLHLENIDTQFTLQDWTLQFDELRVTGSLSFETTQRCKDGRLIPVEVLANYVKFGDEERNCAFVRDMTAHKASEERIQRLAHFDTLTGLPNRVLLDDRMRQTLRIASRNKTTFAALLVDIDHFKHVNDNLGHHAGDTLLVELGRRLKLAVREEDMVARLGGDEFLLIIAGADAAAAAHVAEKLVGVLSQPCQIARHELVVTPSIGIAMYPADGRDHETLYKSADIAMYRAKHEGRNGFRFFEPEMQERSARALWLENALRHALKRGQLSLHYQLQMALDGDAIVGVEALLRWNHPELSAISPAEFIPIAEGSGQIIAIGEWVLRQAVTQLKRWHDAGFSSLTMAVNLSAVQFRDPHFPQLVSAVLQAEGLPPHTLELELTEGVTMENAMAAIAIMDDLHARGVLLSIDDFGTGFSSLGHLKRFKINKLKIDQSFVRDIAQDASDRAIVVAIIMLANSLGLQTIAEGVETADQLAFLRANGCNQIQGYYLSRPVPPEQALALIRNHRPL
jgi:diguanylate cyclase (GGDEF)-like protein/PAS domain S-box-containing protein